MGTSDLPEIMYAQNLTLFQANHLYPCYSYYVTLPIRLIALMPIRVRPLGTLYMHD